MEGWKNEVTRAWQWIRRGPSVTSRWFRAVHTLPTFSKKLFVYFRPKKSIQHPGWPKTKNFPRRPKRETHKTLLRQKDDPSLISWGVWIFEFWSKFTKVSEKEFLLHCNTFYIVIRCAGPLLIGCAQSSLDTDGVRTTFWDRAAHTSVFFTCFLIKHWKKLFFEERTFIVTSGSPHSNRENTSLWTSAHSVRAWRTASRTNPVG